MTVPTDPTLIWVQPEWLEEATAWVRARLAEHGLEPTGEIEQPHVRWWSTVLRIPTSEGDLWFKANAPPHAFEARLLADPRARASRPRARAGRERRRTRLAADA